MDLPIAFVIRDELAHHVRWVALPHLGVVGVHSRLAPPATEDVYVHCREVLEFGEVEKRTDPAFFEGQYEWIVVDQKINREVFEVRNVFDHEEASFGPLAVVLSLELSIFEELWFAVCRMVQLQVLDELETRRTNCVEECHA